MRCAILDDYQKVALGLADWSAVASDVIRLADEEAVTGRVELKVAGGTGVSQARTCLQYAVRKKLTPWNRPRCDCPKRPPQR